jgi:cell division ATPase FtsA
MTESLAAARYFLTLSDLAASDEKGFVCLDIGGGTTDISIWQKDNGSNHRLQTSLRFAGRDILIALIQKRWILPTAGRRL